MGIPTKFNKQKAHVWSLIQNGQFEAARKVCSELCKSNKHDPQVWYLLALTLSQLKKYQEAIKAYKTTLKLFPGSLEANYNLALAYQFSGIASEAIKYFRKAIRLDPSSADAHLGLGNCLCSVGKFNQGVKSFRTALNYRHDFLSAKINLGNALKMLGDLDSAESLFSSVIKQSNASIAHSSLAGVYQIRGESQNAIDSYTRSLEIDPAPAATWTNLGCLYEATGKIDFAIDCWRNAIERDFSLIEAHHNLAATYFHTADLPKSQQSFENVLSLDSKHVEALVGLGSIKVSQGEYEDGLKFADKALESDHRSSNAIVLKAKIYEQMGELDKALKTLRPIIDGNIINAAAGSVYANICHSKKRYQDGIEYLEILLKHAGFANWELRQIHFALGKLNDATEKYDDAFLHYQTGNNLKFCKYNPEQQVAYTDRIIKTFPRKYYGKLPCSTCTQERPIFIVGMPRSGTSLVEQILSRHTKVTGGGELTFMYGLASDMYDQSHPEGLEMMGVDALTRISDEYLVKTSGMHSLDTLLTDKLPGNFLHLGAISLLFPSAIIIHCERNPVDTCLSCYFQDFTGDLSFSYNLENLAHYYKEYQRLMQHWKTVLEIPLLNISYEALITDQEKISRELIAFCDLEWDPQCLDFSNSSRFVRTASYDQVRRPIYSNSVERWKNYQQHIGLLLELNEH